MVKLWQAQPSRDDRIVERFNSYSEGLRKWYDNTPDKTHAITMCMLVIRRWEVFFQTRGFISWQVRDRIDKWQELWKGASECGIKFSDADTIDDTPFRKNSFVTKLTGIFEELSQEPIPSGFKDYDSDVADEDEKNLDELLQLAGLGRSKAQLAAEKQLIEKPAGQGSNSESKSKPENFRLVYEDDSQPVKQKTSDEKTAEQNFHLVNEDNSQPVKPMNAEDGNFRLAEEDKTQPVDRDEQQQRQLEEATLQLVEMLDKQRMSDDIIHHVYENHDDSWPDSGIDTSFADLTNRLSIESTGQGNNYAITSNQLTFASFSGHVEFPDPPMIESPEQTIVYSRLDCIDEKINDIWRKSLYSGPGLDEADLYIMGRGITLAENSLSTTLVDDINNQLLQKIHKYKESKKQPKKRVNPFDLDANADNESLLNTPLDKPLIVHSPPKMKKLTGNAVVTNLQLPFNLTEDIASPVKRLSWEELADKPI